MVKLLLGAQRITPISASTGTKVTSLTVTPSSSRQVFTPPKEYDGYSTVTTEAVTSSVDENIIPENIRSGVTILGVSGSAGGGGAIIPREVDANGVYGYPTQSFTYRLPSGVTSLGDRVLFNAFYGCTSLTSVDLSSLTTIAGDYSLNSAFFGCDSLTFLDLSSLTTISAGDGGDGFAMQYAFANCNALTSLDLSSLTTVTGNSSLNSAFKNCYSIVSIDLSSLTTVGNGEEYDSEVMSYAFNGCSALTSVDLSSLTTIAGSSSMYFAFADCTSLTSVNLSSLTTVSGDNAMNGIFYNCTSLTSVDFSNLATLGGEEDSYSMMSYAFEGCTSLTSMSFPSLVTIGEQAFRSTFSGCTSLASVSFPAINSNSFEDPSSSSAFDNMLSGVTGCTVHFPSNMESYISEWRSFRRGFGGTNTTVLFDLPATT